ncbi:MAG: hypothetical protein NUV78_02175 [Candidatus Zambryskibacteria bacterium]|nr:hypothetical protein [Candidatus Zambryskibacteria bacterium]
MQYLSYIMGVSGLTNADLEKISVEIVDHKEDGDREVKIPPGALESYKKLIKNKLSNGFWNEIVGEKGITFIFKFKDGTIKEVVLSKETQLEIGRLCSEFNGDPIEKTSDVIRYISGNSFYKDFVHEHYGV